MLYLLDLALDNHPGTLSERLYHRAMQSHRLLVAMKHGDVTDRLHHGTVRIAYNRFQVPLTALVFVYDAAVRLAFV
jgi:hypothetical protein